MKKDYEIKFVYDKLNRIMNNYHKNTGNLKIDIVNSIKNIINEINIYNKLLKDIDLLDFQYCCLFQTICHINFVVNDKMYLTNRISLNIMALKNKIIILKNRVETKLKNIIKVILESNYLKSVFKIEGKIKINKINEADIDNIDRNYYSQTYSIEHNSNIKNIMLSTLGIENVKICDSNNNEISNINNVNTFKVLIPRVSVTEDKELLLNFRTELLQTSVMFGATTLADRQNMGLLLDPVNFRTVQDRFTVKYKTSKININKIDKDTKIGIKGVTFRFENLAGDNLGEYTTNENGIIELDAQKDLKILNEQKIKVTEIAVPDNYTIDEENKTRVIDIVWGNNITLEFQNEHKKGNIKVYKVDKDNQKIVLGNVEFQLYSHEFQEIIGRYYTDVNGEIYIEKVRTGDYSLIETNTNKWYNLAENKELEVEWNLTSEIIVKNELKKGSIRVIKVDKEDNEIKLQNVKFNLMDNEGNILEELTTNENGEVNTKKYPVRDFRELKLQEVETLENYVLNDEIRTIQLEENKIKDVVFENEKIKGEIQIIKVSADDNKLTGDKKGTPLVGATFDILDEKGNIVDTLVTNEEGKAKSKLLLKGKYRVVEKDSGSPFYLVNTDIFETEIIEHNKVVDVLIEDESVDIDVEIVKKGFKETQSKDSIYYDFSNIHNKSNVSLDEFTWRDSLPTNALRANRVYTGTWNEDLNYSIWYKTNLSDDYIMLKDNLSTLINNEVKFRDVEFKEGEFITDFEFRFGTVKADFREVEQPRLYCDMLDNLGNGFVFVNHTKVSGTYFGKYVEDNDDWTTITYSKEIQLDKLPKTGC